VTDVERLLRDTLTDPRRAVAPDPQQYDQVAVRARAYRRRRARRWAGTALVTATVLAVLIGLTSTVDRARHPRPAGPAASAGAGRGATGIREPAGIGAGRAVDMVAAPGSLYVLESTPARLLRVDPTTMTILASTDILLDPAGLALDRGTGRLWVWSRGGTGRTTIVEYDAATLTSTGGYTAPTEVFGAAATPGALWLATEEGLYRLAEGSPTARPVPGTGSGQVFSVTADPARHRVLTGLHPDQASFAGTQVAAVDLTSLAVTPGGTFDVGKESIAVVGDRIWVGGYGSGGTERLVRLDPRTLRRVGGSPVTRQVGPGAILWAGQSVLWVRDGGDEGLSCVDPSSGAILQQWPAVQGPVASVTGAAFGLGDADGTSNTNSSRLVLAGHCTG
jgi:hypothetical protein